jgi:hypothetical protein
LASGPRDGVLEGTFVFINEKAKNPKIPPSVQGELVAKSAGVSVNTFLSDPFGAEMKSLTTKQRLNCWTTCEVRKSVCRCQRNHSSSVRDGRGVQLRIRTAMLCLSLK